MLYQPPFTDLNDQGLSGVFDEDAVLVKVVKIIDEIDDPIVAFLTDINVPCNDITDEVPPPIPVD